MRAFVIVVIFAALVYLSAAAPAEVEQAEKAEGRATLQEVDADTTHSDGAPRQARQYYGGFGGYPYYGGYGGYYGRPYGLGYGGLGGYGGYYGRPFGYGFGSPYGFYG